MTYNFVPMAIVSALLVLVITWYLLKFFVLKTDHLRVLMYHKVSPNDECDYLTVTSSNLEEQFRFLKRQGYTSILLSDLVNHVTNREPLPEKPVLITFDDGYRDNYTVMYPLLLKHELKANIFLVPAFLQQDTYLQVSDLLAMDPNTIEYGLHSYDHKNYKQLSRQEIEKDIMQSREMLTRMKVPFQQCLAFPYGSFPKRNPFKLISFFNALAAKQITLAFRIGNRLNTLPLHQPLLIQRLDIRGNESFQQFEQKVQKGKKVF